MSNNQRDGKHLLKRMEFEYNGRSYKFILNPEEYAQLEPSKVQVTQTKNGAWLDDFGAGIVTIDFKGSTGFKNGSKDPQSGFNKLKELRDLIRSTYTDVKPGVAVDNKHLMIFHNYTDNEHWVVKVKHFRLYRSIARPLLYMYEISLICLRSLDTPSPTLVASNAPFVAVLPKNEVR